MITTTPYFWDCECEGRYIHFHEASCPVCGAQKESQPNSRVDELKRENLSNQAFKEVNDRIVELDQQIEHGSFSSKDVGEQWLLESKFLEVTENETNL